VITCPERLQHLTRALDQLDRVLNHGSPIGEDGLDVLGWDALLRHLDGGFDHRQHETFDAVAVGRDIATLGVKETSVQDVMGMSTWRESSARNRPWVIENKVSLCHNVSSPSKAITRGRSIAAVPSPNIGVLSEFTSVEPEM
jgi:hypothetical protein